jgi:hypothetical protein
LEPDTVILHGSTLERREDGLPVEAPSAGIAGRQIEKLTTPTPVQRRAFELLGSTVPLTLG